MIRTIHPIAGLVALACILTFWLSTVAAELSGSDALVVAVKTTIPWGLLILIPALALTGATGFRLASGAGNSVIARKRRRMPFIAANGVLILAPAALTLAVLAGRGSFGPLFYTVQALELVAGAVNLTLLGLNARDGLRLSGRWR